MPPPVTPQGLMDKASALAVKLSLWRGKRSETTANKQRHLLAVAEGREPMTDAERTDPRSWWATRPGSQKNLRGNVAKADRLESNHTQDVAWLVMYNLDQDDIIQGRELADSLADEKIDADEWDHEVAFENEQEEEEALRSTRNK